MKRLSCTALQKIDEKSQLLLGFSIMYLRPARPHSVANMLQGLHVTIAEHV